MNKNSGDLGSGVNICMYICNGNFFRNNRYRYRELAGKGSCEIARSNTNAMGVGDKGVNRARKWLCRVADVQFW